MKAGHELNEAKSSFEIVRSCESSSKGTAKTFGRKKMIKDGKGDEGLSTKKSSFKSPSMDTHFPKINYKMSADNTKAGKILERILELEKLTQDSKLKL